MSTYLLTWNPMQYDWQRLPYLVHLSEQGWPVPHDWSCHNTKRIQDGDRVFMVRHGAEPSGIMGSGFVISPKPYPAKKDSSKGHARKPGLFIDVNFDVLLESDSYPILLRSRLGRGALASVTWDSLRSGVHIPDDAAGQLEDLWQRHLARIGWKGKTERADLARAGWRTHPTQSSRRHVAAK
jgi:hypothetical protein